MTVSGVTEVWYFTFLCLLYIHTALNEGQLFMFEVFSDSMLNKLDVWSSAREWVMNHWYWLSIFQRRCQYQPLRPDSRSWQAEPTVSSIRSSCVSKSIFRVSLTRLIRRPVCRFTLGTSVPFSSLGGELFHSPPRDLQNQPHSQQ